jgi:CDP-diacylglycerol--glycerol-3-phosphate 3-phosphatidyltransferase
MCQFIFKKKLKKLFSLGKQRILISSLYLGTESLEQELVNIINQSLSENKDLSVKILLDFTRGLRGEINSKTILQSLITVYAEQVHAFFYHTPKLRGLFKQLLPNRYNETIGLMHMKFCICDNCLVITG